MAANHDKQATQENLGKAGGGLPIYEALFLRYALMPFLRGALSWERAMSMFESEGEKALKLVKPMSREKLFEKALIPKVFGIEDNSRYYSPAMTLWHLIFVGEAIQKGLIELSHGRAIDITVKIENFKPFVEIEDDIVLRYEQFLSNFRSTIQANIGDKNSRTFHIHPWFGKLYPHGWLALAAAHQLVHRRQIEAIVNECRKGLK